METKGVVDNTKVVVDSTKVGVDNTEVVAIKNTKVVAVCSGRYIGVCPKRDIKSTWKQTRRLPCSTRRCQIRARRSPSRGSGPSGYPPAPVEQTERRSLRGEKLLIVTGGRRKLGVWGWCRDASSWDGLGTRVVYTVRPVFTSAALTSMAVFSSPSVFFPHLV